MKYRNLVLRIGFEQSVEGCQDAKTILNVLSDEILKFDHEEWLTQKTSEQGELKHASGSLLIDDEGNTP